jgi:hypothetical protein
MYSYTFCIVAGPKICITTLFVLGRGFKYVFIHFLYWRRGLKCIHTLFVFRAGPKICISTFFVLGAGHKICIIRFLYWGRGLKDVF